MTKITTNELTKIAENIVEEGLSKMRYRKQSGQDQISNEFLEYGGEGILEQRRVIIIPLLTVSSSVKLNAA